MYLAAPARVVVHAKCVRWSRQGLLRPKIRHACPCTGLKYSRHPRRTTNPAYLHDSPAHVLGQLHRAWGAQAERLLGRDAGDLNLIIAHLGAGASMAAIRAGRSVDTSMGLTPLEGCGPRARPPCSAHDDAAPFAAAATACLPVCMHSSKQALTRGLEWQTSGCLCKDTTMAVCLLRCSGRQHGLPLLHHALCGGSADVHEHVCEDLQRISKASTSAYDAHLSFLP